MRTMSSRGPSKPPGYAPRNPDPALSSVFTPGPHYNIGNIGVPASADFTFLSGVAASFNGLQVAIDVPDVLANNIFQFYTGAAPSPPIIGVNVAGLTLATQIALVFAAAALANGYGIAVDGASVRLTQLFPGTTGNVDIFPQAPLLDGGLMSIQGVTISGLVPTFAGGADLSVPLRWGKNYALGFTSLQTPLFREGVG